MPAAMTETDIIIVGAGSAGCTLAARLSESGQYRVLLLEAGTEGSDFFWSRVPVGVSKMIDNPAVNWCYSSEPDEGSGGRRIERDLRALFGEQQIERLWASEIKDTAGKPVAFR